MDSLNRRARIAGLLYLGLVLIGPFSLIYVPSVLFVPGNAAATASNIAAHASLLRLGIYADILGATLAIFLALALYQLFRDVDRNLGVLVVILGGIFSSALIFVNTLNHFGALFFAQGPAFLSAAFTAAQRDAMVMLFWNLHHYGNVINEMFWGLWLLPLGVLTYKSGFLPRIIGVWLVLNGFAYVAQNITGILWPQSLNTVQNIAFPIQFGEIAFMLWILIIGARQPRAVRPAPA
jgi:hypothetical protein